MKARVTYATSFLGSATLRFQRGAASATRMQLYHLAVTVGGDIHPVLPGTRTKPAVVSAGAEDAEEHVPGHQMSFLPYVGMVLDPEDFRGEVDRIVFMLNGTHLNDLEHDFYPTPEHLCHWFWDVLSSSFHGRRMVPLEVEIRCDDNMSYRVDARDRGIREDY